LLVTDPDAADDASDFKSTAAKHGIPLTVVSPRDERLKELYAAPLAIIRPDQHVAWRRTHDDGDLDKVFRSISGAES
jgi:hypothetical protein